MSLLNLFKNEPAKHIKEEPLPSITFVISRIEDLQARKPVYENFKIKSKIEYTNHAGPVEFLKRNIKFPDNDHYFEAKYLLSQGKYGIREKDEATGKTNKVRKNVFIHTFNFDYYNMMPSKRINKWENPDEQTPIKKDKHPLINAVLTYYTLK
jgi:hypothetical protein